MRTRLYVSEATPEQIRAHYAAHLRERGWREEHETADRFSNGYPAQDVLCFAKGDRLGVVTIAGRDGASRSVSVIEFRRISGLEN